MTDDKQLKPKEKENELDNLLENTLTGAGEPLTKREAEILKLIISGKSNKEIARILYRSKRTVESHRDHIMHKLGVNNVADLVKIAVKMGII